MDPNEVSFLVGCVIGSVLVLAGMLAGRRIRSRSTTFHLAIDLAAEGGAASAHRIGQTTTGGS